MSSGDPDLLARIVTERPRLMATARAIAQARTTIQQNAVAQRWQREVTKQADLLLALPALTQSWTHVPEETGAAPLPRVRPPQSLDGPAAPLDIARLFCLRMQTLGITWLLTDDARYRDRAKQELIAVCDFPDWAGDKFLVTAETAFGAAIGYDWLYKILAPAERERVARAIVDKAIETGLEQFAASSPTYWTRTAMNWNLVCNSGLMLAALSVWECDARAARLFRLCADSVRTGFGEYGPDGGWVEGPGYWHYATQYAIFLLDSMSTALGTDLGLAASAGLSKTGFFRLHAASPSGKLFNFADSEDRHSGGYWLFWLAKRYRHPVDAWIEQHVGKIHPMDLLWFDQKKRTPSRLQTAKRFRAAGVVMLRGGWSDPNATYLGIKGGANDACEHGHYDLGSFVLDAGGIRWAIDLGPDDYNLPGYFTPAMRSRYYRTSTIGHNTIVVDSKCQPHSGRAVNVDENFAADLAVVVMDLSAAYPSTASALRGLALIARRHVLVVDEIVPEASLSRVDWQMHTEAQVTLDGSMATLTYPAQNPDAEPARFYAHIVEPGSAAWSLESAAPPDPPGQNANAGIAKLVLRRERVTQPLRISVFMSPEAGACANLESRLAHQPLSSWIRPRPPRRREA